MKKNPNKITTYEVVVKEIEIDGRYFTIKYDFWVNGVLKTKDGEYNDDHSWEHDVKGFMDILVNGLAAKNVMEQEQ